MSLATVTVCNVTVCAPEERPRPLAVISVIRAVCVAAKAVEPEPTAFAESLVKPPLTSVPIPLFV